MQFMRFKQSILRVSVGLLALALLWPSNIAVAAVPCNNGETDGIKSVATTSQQPKQNPNTCPVDNAQQNTVSNLQFQTSAALGESEFGGGDPTHPPAEPIAFASTLFSTDANTACLTFDDESLWRGGGENRWYAGWGIQALNVDGQGLYKENASFELERSVGYGFALKVDHGKPFRSQIVSPEFEVPAGATVVAKVSYSMSYPTPNHSMWAEISVHVSGDTNAPVAKGYFVAPDTWRKLISKPFTTPTATKVQVTLQGNNLYTLTGNAIYFDNIEIWVDGRSATQCTFAEDGLKLAG